MTRSTVFVNKQYEFIKKGHTESEAFRLAEKALQEEEALALKQVYIHDDDPCIMYDVDSLTLT